MTDKRRGLGRGLGALIPSAPATGASRPSDVFFAERAEGFTGNVAAGPAVDVIVAPDAGASTPVEPASATVSDGPEESATPPASGSGIGETPNGEVSSEAGTQPDGDGLTPVPGAEFLEVPVGDIHPNPKQPRTVFDEDELAELVHSVREIGILQPIVVRRVVGAATPYELIMGERRWRATTEAGLATIPAIIRETTDENLLRDALLENLHRAQLNPLEEAAAYRQLLDDFGCTHDELADRIGRSRPQISNMLRLLRLPPLVQRRVAAGVLSAGHARALLGLSDAAAMERLAQRIVAEGLSVRSVEEIVTLSSDEPASRTSTSARAAVDHPRLDELASSLSDRLDTRVALSLGKRKGRMTVEFASEEDLDRIIALLGLADDER